MAEELTRAERIARAQTAERLVEEIGSHISVVERKYHEDWARAQTPEAREAVWYRLQALTDVVRDLTAQVMDGQMAAKEQEYDDGRTTEH